MAIESRTYMQLLRHGSSAQSNPPVEVGTRDITGLSIPKDTYAFQFYEIVIAHLEYEGRQLELRSDPLNRSPLFYYGGHVYSREEYSRKMTFSSFSLSDFDRLGCKAVIQTRFGKIIPFQETDVCIPLEMG